MWKTASPRGCVYCTVLSLLGILSLDWNFWNFLRIFGKVWKCVKWIILVHFANHVWFYFLHLSWHSDFIVHHHRFRDFLSEIGIFRYCSGNFWSCICESHVCTQLANCSWVCWVNKLRFRNTGKVLVDNPMETPYAAIPVLYTCSVA